EPLDGVEVGVKLTAEQVEALQRAGQFATVAMDQLNRELLKLPNVHSSLEGVDTTLTHSAKSLGELAQAFSNLANISGGAFGGAVRDIGQIVGSLHLAETAMATLAKDTSDWVAQLSSAVSILGAMYQIGMTLEQIIPTTGSFANRNSSATSFASFMSQFSSTQDMIDKIQKAFIAEGKTAADANAAISQIFKDIASGSPNAIAEIQALQQALDRTAAAAQHTTDLLNEASSKYGPSQTDLENAEKHAHELFDAMLAAGTYTQDQLNKAYYDWQKAMADAGNEAAKAWVKAHDAATSATDAQNSAIQKLQDQYDSLNQSVSQEAPEADMGVIEKAQRAQMAQIKDQITAAQTSAQAQSDAAATSDKSWQDHANEWTSHIETETDNAASHITDAFSGIEIHIPIFFDKKDNGGLEGLSTGGMVSRGKILHFDTGGIATANGKDRIPALLAEGEMVLTPQQQRSMLGGASIGQVNVYATGADLQDMQAFAPKFIEALRIDTGGMRSAIERVA
ncbi:MAG TPA: hypothetical protein VF443_05430, partial [Nitrospira sp.]